LSNFCFIFPLVDRFSFSFIFCFCFFSIFEHLCIFHHIYVFSTTYTHLTRSRTHALLPSVTFFYLSSLFLFYSFLSYLHLSLFYSFLHRHTQRRYPRDKDEKKRKSSGERDLPLLRALVPFLYTLLIFLEN